MEHLENPQELAKDIELLLSKLDTAETHSEFDTPECVCVFGRSGTGKSTILSALLKGRDYDIQKDLDSSFKFSNGLNSTTK